MASVFFFYTTKQRLDAMETTFAWVVFLLLSSIVVCDEAVADASDDDDGGDAHCTRMP